MRTVLLVLVWTVVLAVGQKLGIHFGDQFAGIRYADPDLAGYRYCAYWELADGTHLHSTCDPYSMERCGKPVDFEYKCCSGFEEAPGMFYSFGGHKAPVCTKMISPFNDCAETVLQSADYAAFAPGLSTLSQLKQDRPDEPYTIFAPKVGDGENGDGPLQVEQHVVKGRLYVEDLKDGMDLETLDGKRKLHVKKYPYGVTTVDCLELLDADLECRSGLIHKIRQPLGGRFVGPNVDRSSVLTFLQTYPDTQEFAEDLPSSVKSDLGNVASGKRYTVLAPRNQAWSSLKRRYPDQLIGQIAGSHVLQGQVCSSGLIRSVNMQHTIDGDSLEIGCELNSESHERRFVRSVCGKKHELVETDMTAANGVIHLLDEPVIPVSAFTLEDLKSNKECTEALKITEFVKLLEECDLYMEPGTKYAVILPLDEAFDWWSRYEQFREEYQRFQTDKEYRCRVARYHIMKSDDRLKNINSFASHTMGHRTNNKEDPLYETTYFKKTPTGSELNFHYAPIPNMKAFELQDASVYVTPRINVPPEFNMTDILASRPDTTLVSSKTAEASMDEKHFRKNAPKNLYLVTTDDGWKDPRAEPGSASPFRPEHTMYKGDSLEKFLLLHHVPLYLWGGDIGYFDKNTVHKFMSSAGVELIFWMDENGVMRIGYEGLPRNEWPRVVKFNLPARDGIMWLLDGILKCPEKVCPLFVEDIDYYDMYVSACQTSHLPNEPNAPKDFRQKPTEVASRHPDHCTVILQLSEKSVNLIEA
ncbi:Gynecophoral canal protein [Fasciola hepatica]|uniref:Gynecophoral canal protein n=1 Tax=Fasciola hepatica TaxID=6192 RepID=A0A4E0RK23_FASHE|nr:Gynecophoral canal protein [Fasciola hepatica]